MDVGYLANSTRQPRVPPSGSVSPSPIVTPSLGRREEGLSGEEPFSVVSPRCFRFLKGIAERRNRECEDVLVIKEDSMLRTDLKEAK